MSSQGCSTASQDKGMPHRLALAVHQLLLGLHMVLCTLLQKAFPKVVSEPLVMPMMMGTVPYRKLCSKMYHDGFLLAVSLVLAIAIFSWK